MTQAATNTELSGTSHGRAQGRAGNLLSFIVGVLALWLAVSQRSCLDLRSGTELASGEKAGDLAYGRGAVLYRPRGSFAWRDLAGGSAPLSRGSVIFVGPNSSARLQLEDGNVVDILPNTLLELGESELSVGWNDFLVPFFKSRSVIAFQLHKGAVQIQLQADAGQMRIRNGAQDYEISAPSAKTREPARAALHVEKAAGGGVLQWEVQGGAVVAALPQLSPIPATPPMEIPELMKGATPQVEGAPVRSAPRKPPFIGKPKVLPTRIE